MALQSASGDASQRFLAGADGPAALALPGLAPSPIHAAKGDDFSFQYGRYQEGERDLFGDDARGDHGRV